VGEVDCKLGITEMQYGRCVEYICKRITFGLKAFLRAQYFFLCKLNYPCEGFPAQNVTEERVRLGYIVVILTKARALPASVGNKASECSRVQSRAVSSDYNIA
jgi:hypothetical protein